MAVMRKEATKKPMTNFGNLHHISMALGLSPHSSFSHLIQAIKAKIKDQMPIHISLPMTFISVNAWMAVFSLPAMRPYAVAAAKPAASANSDVPTHAPATPGERLSIFDTKGMKYIITKAWTTTRVTEV